MSVTSGFFNSLNHDRRYNAQQMSAIFDGIINDGVFANIGDAFAISVDTGVTINIGVGKAWFNSAWVYNDATLPKTLEGSEVVLDRIDAVVVEVDHNESVRMGDIKIVKGTPSSSPTNPTLVNTTNKHQYPLAYIYRSAGSTEITQADITNMVGTSSCPYITGILQVQNIDNIVAQWNAQWNQWYAAKITETDTDASELLAEMKSEFDVWFNDIQALLDDDVATALAAQVAELQGKFDDLARDSCVYDTIEDSDFDMILGSDGTPLQGKTVFGAGGNSEDIDLSGYAKQVDLEEVKATKLDITEKLVPNLLDNSDFTNPVNQRSSTEYSGTGYTIDRWRSTNSRGILTVKDDCINIAATTNGNAYFRHTFPEDLNGIYTLVICVRGTGTGFLYMSKDNSGVSVETPVQSQNDWTVILATLNTADMETAPNQFTIGVKPGENYDIKYAALYEGEYTIDNLPVYRPKGYITELLECQRYLYYVHGYCAWTAYKSSTAYGFLTLPVKMRIAPTVTAESFEVRGANDDDGDSHSASVISIGYSDFANTMRITLDVNISSHQPAILITQRLVVSAEL